MAALGPVLLVVDDAHWADAASLRFLAFLLPRLEELRIGVLLAARPADAGPGQVVLSGLTMDPATELIRLAPLTDGGVARLIAEGLGSDPEPGFVAACRKATGGTPFLIRTLVAALADEGIDPVEASSQRLPRVATATTGRWTLLQLSRLGPDAARLARAVAVLECCDLVMAAALAGLGTARRTTPLTCSCAPACWRSRRSPSPIRSCAPASMARCRRPSVPRRTGARRAC